MNLTLTFSFSGSSKFLVEMLSDRVSLKLRWLGLPLPLRSSASHNHNPVPLQIFPTQRHRGAENIFSLGALPPDPPNTEQRPLRRSRRYKTRQARPWRTNGMREAKQILRSGTAERSETAEGRESPTDRSFLHYTVGTSTKFFEEPRFLSHLLAFACVYILKGRGKWDSSGRSAGTSSRRRFA